MMLKRLAVIQVALLGIEIGLYSVRLDSLIDVAGASLLLRQE
jgi:hypothetical protein